jgi:hypothetical protein
MFDVLARAHPKELELSPEQHELLLTLFEDYRRRHHKLRAVQKAVRTGEVAMTPEELANVDREIAALEDETLNLATGMLSSDQLDLAREHVLRGRLKRYGFVGLLTADEVNIGLKANTNEIITIVRDEQNESKDELEEVLAEFEKIRAEYMKKIAAIQRKQFELALIRLGDDGEKIRKLLESLERKEVGGKGE